MILLLANCTKLDGYDPTTGIVKWIITHDS